MKYNIENEITFYSREHKNENDLIYILKNIFECKDLPMISYGNFLEMRLENQNYDKYKISFKINHGTIYFKISTKNRLSSVNDSIQSYDERMTEWQNLSEFDLAQFDKKIISFYMKTTYKTKVKYRSSKYKLNLQHISFIDEFGEYKDEMNYLELESKHHNELTSLINNLNNIKWHNLDIPNSKIVIGKQNLSSINHLHFNSIEDLANLIYSKFKTTAVNYFDYTNSNNYLKRTDIIKDLVMGKVRALDDIKLKEYFTIHLNCVAEFSSLFAYLEGLNPEIAIVAGYLHDISLLTNNLSENHAERSTIEAKKILEESNLFNSYEIDIICSAVKNHSSKENIDGKYDEILKNADVLELYFHSTKNSMQMPYHKLQRVHEIIKKYKTKESEKEL